MTTTEQIKGIVERLGALRRYLWRWCQINWDYKRGRKDLSTRILEQSKRSGTVCKKPSIQEKMGQLAGLKVAIIGDIMHSRVALSNIYLLKLTYNKQKNIQKYVKIDVI